MSDLNLETMRKRIERTNVIEFDDVEDLMEEVTALRAELDAAKAANATLEAEKERWRKAAQAEPLGLRAAFHGAMKRAQTAEAERDEAREFVRHVQYFGRIIPQTREDLRRAIAKWDASRPAPDTNRDAGDERASEIADEDAMMAGDKSGA